MTIVKKQIITKSQIVNFKQLKFADLLVGIYLGFVFFDLEFSL